MVSPATLEGNSARPPPRQLLQLFSRAVLAFLGLARATPSSRPPWWAPCAVGRRRSARQCECGRGRGRHVAGECVHATRPHAHRLAFCQPFCLSADSKKSQLFEKAPTAGGLMSARDTVLGKGHRHDQVRLGYSNSTSHRHVHLLLLQSSTSSQR